MFSCNRPARLPSDRPSAFAEPATGAVGPSSAGWTFHRIALSLAAAAALAAAGMPDAAQAQYQWVDGAGRMVYSDLPPPNTIDPSKVLRRPERPGRPAVAAAAPGGAAAAPTLNDRELAFRKRMAEQSDAERKSKEASEAAAKLARACDDARGNLRKLESGEAISRIRADGEREIISDDERNERLRTMRRDLAERC